MVDYLALLLGHSVCFVVLFFDYFECDDLMGTQAFLFCKKEGCVCVCWCGRFERRGEEMKEKNEKSREEGRREGGCVSIGTQVTKQASKNKFLCAQYGVWTHVDSSLVLFHSSSQFLEDVGWVRRRV